MRRTALLSAGLLVVTACESPIRPAPQPPPTPVPQSPAPAPTRLAVDLSGDYTLTFEVGGGCEEVPKELRIRSYAAKISFSAVFGSSYWFLADLSGAKFDDGQRSVGMEVGADYVAVDLSDNVIIEEPSPGTYLATSGYGGALVPSSELSTISGPYTGYFKYCAATAGGTDQCSAVTMTHDMCKAENSQWTLTRR